MAQTPSIKIANHHTLNISKDITVPYGQLDDAFDSFAPTSQHPHVKRDNELLNRFGCLMNKGIRYLEEGIVKGVGNFGNRPQDFGGDPFGNNGWTLGDDDDDIPEIWDDVFEHLPPREPRQEDYNLVKLNQDQDFANVWHPKNTVSQAL